MSIDGFNRPQKKRYMRRGIAGGLLFVALLMLLADKQQKEMLASGRLNADDVSAKIMGLFTAPIRGVEMIFANIGDRSRAFKQNKSLTAEVTRLQEMEHKILDLELRLKIYEDLLGMDDGTDGEVERIAARSISETNGPFVHSALLNAGKDKNIEPGNAVMTADGLIGHVVRAGDSSARVLLLNDFNSHISVMSQRSKSRAIMIGSNDDSPRLDYISPEADWQPGDRVVTSGDDGVLPGGLKIGIVETLEQQQLGVKLYTKNKPIDWVWVYLFNRVEQPPLEAEEEVAETAESQIVVDGSQ